MAGFRYPRTGFTVFLLHLSATTELVELNLIPQHDPQPDPEFASHCHSRLPQAFLDQFTAEEKLQLRMLPHRVDRRPAPEKPHQGIVLFTHPTKPLPPSP